MREQLMDFRMITKDELAALLREAEKAHAEYEKMLGGKDDDWPTWPQSNRRLVDGTPTAAQ